MDWSLSDEIIKHLDEAVVHVSDAIGKLGLVAPRIDDEIVYHYCSGAVLEKIIMGQRIRASNIRYLNDPQEFLHGTKYLGDALEASGLPEKVCKQVIDTFPVKICGRSQVYISCFSSATDKLSQWRAYADDGRGYAVGFSVADMGYSAWDVFCSTHRVVYDETEKQNLAAAIVTAIKEYFDTIPKDADFDAKLVTALYFVLVAYSAIFKHTSFSEEAEYRLLIPDVPGTVRDAMIGTKRMGVFNRGGILVPCIDVGTKPLPYSDSKPRLPIKKVLVGPCLEEYKAIYGVMNCLEIAGYGGDIHVDKSNIPYLP